jgi:hypothetical protein
MMVGSNKNFYRRKAMTEFGQDNQFFGQADLMLFMNTYKTAEGRTHRMTQTDKHQLTSMLIRSPDFKYHPGQQKRSVGKWEYVGEPKSLWNRNGKHGTND